MARRKKKRGGGFDFEATLLGTRDDKRPGIEIAHFMGFGVVSYVLDLGRLGLPRDVTSTDDMMRFEKVIPNSIGGGDTFNIIEMVKLAGREPEPDLVEWLRRLKMIVYNEELDRLIAAGEVTHRDGALEFFRFVEGLGLETALGSLTPKKQAEKLFAASGIDLWFKVGRIVLLENVKNKKPAPDVYIETARRMVVGTDEQIVFGDSLNDVKAGIDAGSIVIATPTVTTPSYTAKLLDAGAIAVFESWRDPALYDLMRQLAA